MVQEVSQSSQSAHSTVSTSRRSGEEIVILVLSATAVLGISPFIVLRLMRAEWLIGIMDVLAAAGACYLFYYVYKTRKTEVPSFILSLLFMITMITTVYLKGAQQVYWCYPAMIAVFYLVEPGRAVILTSLSLLAVLPALFLEIDNLTFIAIIITLVTTNVFAYVFAARTQEQRAQLMLMATKDPLTGVGNRRAMEAELDQVIHATRRHQAASSLLIMDLDHFKSINDTYGHGVGDRVLMRFAELIQSRIRITDSLFRFGGEEFVILVQGQDLNASTELADQLRRNIEQEDFKLDRRLTMSVGVAEYESTESRDSWLRRADKALFEAKQNGRNRVCQASPTAPDQNLTQQAATT